MFSASSGWGLVLEEEALPTMRAMSSLIRVSPSTLDC